MSLALPPPESFGALPLDQQLLLLGSLVPRENPRGLLAVCSALRDPAPLAWLCGRLARELWLDNPSNAQWFATFLVGQSDTAVDKVLKALWSEQQQAPQIGRGLCATLLHAMSNVSVSRLAMMCLIDRCLHQNYPVERAGYLEGLVQQCLSGLGEANTDPLTVDRLAQVAGEQMGQLEQAAQQTGPAAVRALAEARSELARKAIEVLAAVPKAVSQANAEVLLSRRVYTDPGHFLIELLQNADDAAARLWRVSFEAARIVVWHDGTPFDARDLVGVTSIGQTTKHKQQIGLFGVGFKSVYEVTDRPQIYSGFYRFEVADVSVPKILASRPADLPQDGTVLVLPLRDGRDPIRSAKALYRRACALDPVVLFALRSVDVIELSLSAAAGGPARRAIYKQHTQDTTRSVIRQEPEGTTRAYILQDDEVQYDRGKREAGKPERTRAMVGLPLDDEGGPQSLDPTATTVYS
jgi:hypothetical protein